MGGHFMELLKEEIKSALDPKIVAIPISKAILIQHGGYYGMTAQLVTEEQAQKIEEFLVKDGWVKNQEPGDDTYYSRRHDQEYAIIYIKPINQGRIQFDTGMSEPETKILDRIMGEI